MKSCVELLRASGINILVVFSDIPVFCLDYKLPTTLKHRTRNIDLNKEELFKYLAECVTSIDADRQVIFIHGKKVLSLSIMPISRTSLKIFVKH